MKEAKFFFGSHKLQRQRNQLTRLDTIRQTNVAVPIAVGPSREVVRNEMIMKTIYSNQSIYPTILASTTIHAGRNRCNTQTQTGSERSIYATLHTRPPTTVLERNNSHNQQLVKRINPHCATQRKPPSPRGGTRRPNFNFTSFYQCSCAWQNHKFSSSQRNITNWMDELAGAPSPCMTG